MGNNYDGQEKAIAILKDLPPAAKEFLNHHIANAMSGVIGGITTGDLEMAKRSAWHIMKDLELAGIREKFK